MMHVPSRLSSYSDEATVSSFKEDDWLMDVVERYKNYIFNFPGDYPIITEQSTINEFKIAIMSIPELSRQLIIISADADKEEKTKQHILDNMTPEQVERHEERKLRFWLIKKTFVIVGLLLIILVGFFIYHSLYGTSELNTEAYNQIFGTLGEILKIMFGS